ncbi:MAG TPA: DinB family protein [Candidatus Limnocylindrales bacterium]|nr:DinB family protein [Candidatus Limnocylindrales bacterium]
MTHDATSLAARIGASARELAELRPTIEAGEPWPLAERYGDEPEATWGPREVLAHLAEMLPFWLGETERILAAGSATPFRPATGATDPAARVPAAPRPGAVEWPPEASAPPSFGRVASDPLRIGTIGRDRSLPLRELFDRIDVGVERWLRRLATLGEPDLARIGRHPTLGELSVGAVIERFVAGHLEEHVGQLRSLLRSVTREPPDRSPEPSGGSR